MLNGNSCFSKRQDTIQLLVGQQQVSKQQDSTWNENSCLGSSHHTSVNQPLFLSFPHQTSAATNKDQNNWHEKISYFMHIWKKKKKREDCIFSSSVPILESWGFYFSCKSAKKAFLVKKKNKMGRQRLDLLQLGISSVDNILWKCNSRV